MIIQTPVIIQILTHLTITRMKLYSITGPAQPLGLWLSLVMISCGLVVVEDLL